MHGHLNDVKFNITVSGSAVCFKSYSHLNTVTAVKVTQQHSNTFSDFQLLAGRKNLQVKAGIKSLFFHKINAVNVCRYCNS